MSPQTRLLSVVAGAAALAGLTYTVSRIAFKPRAALNAPRHERPAGARRSIERASPEAWESALIAQSAPSDALDLALDLDGIFDASSEEVSEVTVRPTVRLPHAQGGDDEDPPSPDDLGRAWLSQATQSERSLNESDLSERVEDLASLDEAAQEPSEDDEELELALARG